MHARAGSTVAVALFCLGVFLLLAHVYAPLDIRPLDGSAIKSSELSLRSVVEIGLLAGVVLLFVQLQRGRGLSVAALFAAALALVAVGYAGFLAAVDEPTALAQAAPAAPAPNAGSSAIDGNVYHIVLDRMQTEGFLQVLERTRAADAFKGFELFKNNVANYLRTPQSAASYFTGTYFEGYDYIDWIRAWLKKGLMADTCDEANYHISMHLT